VPAIS